ncbi:hypothetical protein Tco_0971122 [Tanacetum coccineum]
MASTRASISKVSKRPKINIIPPKQLFVDLTQDDTKTPSPKLPPSGRTVPLKVKQSLSSNQIPRQKNLTPDEAMGRDSFERSVRLGGHQGPSHACHATCFGNISSSINNELLDIVEQVMRPLALRQTRRPQSDRGKAHRSVSSSSSHHQGTSSYQHDDDDDDDDIETSEPSTLISPYHLILTLLIHSTTKTFSYASPLLSERELSLHDKTNCSTNATNA